MKTFLVEIDYEETPQNINENSPVLYDTAVQCTLEDMMYGYASCKSISLSHGYSVNVKQIDNNKKDIKDEIINNLDNKLKMSEEDSETEDYIEGIYDSIKIVKETK
jgi:hypothetical protein